MPECQRCHEQEKIACGQGAIDIVRNVGLMCRCNRPDAVYVGKHVIGVCADSDHGEATFPGDSLSF